MGSFLFFLRVIFLILHFVSAVSTLILEKLHNFLAIHIGPILVMTLFALAWTERPIAGQRQSIADQIVVRHMGVLDSLDLESLTIETETILG